jgi:hypothetical protein
MNPTQFILKLSDSKLDTSISDEENQIILFGRVDRSLLV